MSDTVARMEQCRKSRHQKCICVFDDLFIAACGYFTPPAADISPLPWIHINRILVMLFFMDTTDSKRAHYSSPSTIPASEKPLLKLCSKCSKILVVSQGAL